ncbi:hypothetical protein AaE_013376 [Aphanomyces astaci]|uniref:Uncharacterized protein n=1 Tax=Aphanomyces astaci TaxID=112090 RepID=A0A6A4ZAR5_APHAT|nr:hypothetical protein AaE_013376 [Aphanomyces astaci]
MHYERAGDQFVGRVVAGLPLNNAKFAVLPPHFKDTNSAAVLGAISATFPALADVAHLRGILAHGLASLVHHSNYILDILPTKHTIFHTAPFRQPLIMVALKAELVSTTRRLQPSGIPPYIEVYRLLEVQVKSATYLMSATSTTTPSPPLCSDRPFMTRYKNSMLPTWGCRMHKVPEGFEFPLVDTSTAWSLWWLGNERLGHIQYNAIDPRDLATKLQRRILSERTTVPATE